MPEYRRFVADRIDSGALRDLKSIHGMAGDDTLLRETIKEFSHQSDKSVLNNFEQVMRLKMMKNDPKAHYDLLKRRPIDPKIEKLEDLKLRLGLRDPTQTNNNLS